MSSSLSKYVDNLAEGLIKLIANIDRLLKNGKHVKLNIKIVSVVLNTQIS